MGGSRVSDPNEDVSTSFSHAGGFGGFRHGIGGHSGISSDEETLIWGKSGGLLLGGSENNSLASFESASLRFSTESSSDGLSSMQGGRGGGGIDGGRLSSTSKGITRFGSLGGSGGGLGLIVLGGDGGSESGALESDLGSSEE